MGTLTACTSVLLLPGVWNKHPCCSHLLLLQIISCAAAPLTADEVGTKSGVCWCHTLPSWAARPATCRPSVPPSRYTRAHVPRVHEVTSAAAVPAADSFDFKTYMTTTAEQVNAALDAACPLKYPETLNESMR